MKTSEQIDQISKSMSLAQGEMKPASKSTVNPFFKSKYSTLAQVWEVIREPLSKNGLCVFQDLLTTDHGISVITRVCHVSGQWIQFGPLEVPLTKKDAQGVGSASSYGKRYSLCTAIGCVSEEEDDDGEKAVGRKSEIVAVKTIGKSEWTELNKIIDQCDKNFQENLWKYLKDEGIDSFADMDEKTFVKLKKGCVSNIEKNMGIRNETSKS